MDNNQALDVDISRKLLTKFGHETINIIKLLLHYLITIRDEIV